MLKTRLFASVAFIAVATSAQAQADNQASSTAAPHLIVVKLIQQPGKVPFAFEPAAFTAGPGDTLRFVQEAETMHNVHFKIVPKGAKLGGAATSPYLVTVGQTYSVVVDARFAAGTYELVCDPHDAVGMHAMLTVLGAQSVVHTP